MTTIRYIHNAEGFEICSEGHAGYCKEAGKDIVCAGISTLLSEMLVATENAGARGEIKKLKYSANSGKITISFRYKNIGSMKDIIELIISCLCEIEKQYPDNLKVINSLQ